MQVQPTTFQGKFEVNPLFNKFKEELNPAQKDIYNNIIKRVENKKDGRVFKFDRITNPEHSGGAEVGIFERKFLIDKTLWIPLFCSTREKAVQCFDQLHNIYK